MSNLKINSENYGSTLHLATSSEEIDCCRKNANLPFTSNKAGNYTKHNRANKIN